MDDHIRAAGRRTEAEGLELAAGLLRDCWPAGHADRALPAALEWLRRWRPARALTPVPACGCSAGRCGTCN